jgi:hypothetical protein
MATFEKIATVDVGSGGAASIDFSSIASSWTDLCIKISIRSNHSGVADFVKVRFNGVGTSYSLRAVYGVDNTAASQSFTELLGAIDGNNATSSTFGNGEYYIPNYAGSTNKSLSVDSIGESNATNGSYTWLGAGLWSNTAAITSIAITPFNGTSFNQYSTATLYGIKKA